MEQKKTFFLLAYLFVTSILALWKPFDDIFGCLNGIIFSIIAAYDYTGKREYGLARFVWAFIAVFFCSSFIDSVGSQYIFSNTSVWSESDYAQKIIRNFIYLVYFASIFFYLYYRIFKKGLFVHRQLSEHYFVVLYTLGYLIIYAIFVFYGKSGRVQEIILGTSFILTAALLPVFAFYLHISKHYQQRTQQQEVYIQAELAHFQQYKLAQEETARFRHDIKNNLLCMHDMLQRGKTEEANQYLEDLLDGVDTLSARYVTGDEVLDSIVAFKAQTMDAQGIIFQLDGVLAGGLKWKPVDICNVFANALDNAIEACERLPRDQRQITMTIKSTAQYWFVRIENPVLEVVDTKRLFRKKDGYSSKTNPEQHGMGTYNMKHTVEANGGVLRAEYANDRFTLEIMIDKELSH